MKRLNKYIPKPFFFLLSAACYLLCPFRLLAFNAHQPFDISADIIDYVDDTQEITARGHVVIVQSSSTLHADVVRYDRIHKRLIARGKVVLREKEGVMLGDQLDYDLVKEVGVVMGGKGFSSSWFFQGASWEKIEDYYVGRDAAFTSCDLIDPHYHIKASRVHLIPDRLFWSWNNVFYADTLPVMYSPFMYKYLDKQWITFQAQPGSDSLLGSFAKTTTTMRFSNQTYDKLYLDYYTVAGKGLGNELDFDHPDKNKGSFFGYYINPHPDAVLSGAPTGPQYNLRGYLWQKISKDIQLQANTNIRQNVSFNTQYFAQDPNQSQNDILSSVAMTQQTHTFNQHLVAQREDAPDSGDTSAFATTHIQNASVPSYDFTLYERPLWSPKSNAPPPGLIHALTPGATGPFMLPAMGFTSSLMPVPTGYSVASSTIPAQWAPTKPSKIGPIMFSMTGGAQNEFERADERIHSGANTIFNLGQSFPFARDWSFGTRVSPQINWQDKGEVGAVSTDTQKGFTGRTTFANGFRWRGLPSVTIDADHTLTERLKPNDLAFARDTTDHGVEANNVSLSANVRPSSRVLFRSSSGFDFRRLDDESLADYQQRKWSTWSTDLTYDPNRYWEYYVSNQVGHYPFRTQSWQEITRYTGFHKTAISTGFVYNRNAPGSVTWNQSVGYYFGPGWRIDAGLNALVPSDSLTSPRDANIINTSLVLVRDMHCWQTQFIYTDTPPFSRSFSILFNVKLGGNDKKDISDQNLENQFYPWRNSAVDPTIR